MTTSPQEIGGFMQRANALLINLGTFDAERQAATETAIAAAAELKLPWVLDPVLIDRSPERAKYARALVDAGPKAIRLNAAEFTALTGRGADQEAAADFARGHGSIVALSGKTDFISDGRRNVAIANGHALMAKVTAMGCAASALAAACIAVEPDAWAGAAAGLLLLGVAGEIAANEAKGPGSFAVAIIDTLNGLDARTLTERAQVS